MIDTQQRRISDGQLLQEKLRIDDPSELINISQERPDPSLTPEIIGEYHFDKNSCESIRCCHCHDTPHWNGFLIRDESLSRYTIGSTCGPKYYQLSFNTARNNHKELLNRQNYLKRINLISQNSDNLIRSYESIVNSQYLHNFEAKRKELINKAPDPALRLARFATGDSLTETVQIRDYAAEERRNNENPDNQSGNPIYTFELRPIGQLQGIAMVYEKGDLREEIDKLKEAIEKILSVANNPTDSISTKNLLDIIRQFDKLSESVQRAYRDTEAANDFFSLENLERLKLWSKRFQHFKLDHENGKLLISLKNHKRATVSPLKQLLLPPLPSMVSQ